MDRAAGDPALKGLGQEEPALVHPGFLGFNTKPLPSPTSFCPEAPSECLEVDGENENISARSCFHRHDRRTRALKNMQCHQAGYSLC